MHFFTDYIEPLTTWLRSHPDWALFITFLVSFSESLAVVGSIVPGSVTMTAIGILAGSGVMRIDLTLLAASLGAIVGDGVSYILGYVFSDRLPSLWPFSRYPNWLSYGKAFFSKHGGKSVFLGRFVGPLRSIIPVIAGMMHMPKLQFTIANIFSGLAWPILYVMPGVIIGTASAQLSTEQATRLFILVLLILILAWLFSRLLAWGFQHTQTFVEKKLHEIWVIAKTNSFLKTSIRAITPPHERNHERTASIVLSIILCFTLLMICMSGELNSLNAPIYYFLQSIRTSAFDAFFIPGILILNTASLSLFLASTSLLLILRYQYRSFFYFLSLNTSIFLLSYFLNHSFTLSIPLEAIINPPEAFFIHTLLALATANFIFLNLMVQKSKQIALKIQMTILFFLALTGFAHLYLGNCLMITIFASYFLGFGLCFLHWLFYRCKKYETASWMLPLILFTSTGIVITLIYFKTTLKTYQHHTQQYVLSHRAWWNQEQPLLPLYATNRIGKPIGLINIQYLGSIHHFEHALKSHGWRKQTDSFLQRILVQTDKKTRKIQSATLKTELYQSQKPDLIMTYAPDAQTRPLVLRLWQSNYYLLNHTHPLWIGSIQPYSFGTLDKLMTDLDSFEINTLVLNIKRDYVVSSFPTLLIIREVR